MRSGGFMAHPGHQRSEHFEYCTISFKCILTYGNTLASRRIYKKLFQIQGGSFHLILIYQNNLKTRLPEILIN